MNTLLIAARAVHYATALMLFGEFVFFLVVANPVWRDAGYAPCERDSGVRRRLHRVALWAIVASVASGAAWLAAEAAIMSGMPLAQAMHPDTLSQVLGETVFGRVWVLRLGITVALCVLLRAMRQVADRKGSVRMAVGALVAAAAYLATLAWVGHASAGRGLDRSTQIASDAMHLLAAGAWLGGLPGLAYLLWSAPSHDLAARATARFSAMGMMCVSALVVTGLIMAWYLVGTLPALPGTEYGWLLLAKLALFALMVSLAAVNRYYLTPRIIAHDLIALGRLRRNALWEMTIGIVLVSIVAVLGVTNPETRHHSTLSIVHAHSS